MNNLGLRITEEEIRKLAEEFDIDWSMAKAIIDVESNGKPFYKTGEPVILFEGRYFHKFTKGIYDKQYPTISHSAVIPSYYNMPQLPRLEQAYDLVPEAALMSASWGAMQVMGFNYKMIGYSNVFEYVRDMFISEYFQIRAGFQYIESAGLIKAVKAKNYRAIARGYNGPTYEKYGYHTKLQKRDEHWSNLK